MTDRPKPILIEVESFNGVRGPGYRREIIEAPAGSSDEEIERIARQWYDERHTFRWKRAACQRKGGCATPMACRVIGCDEKPANAEPAE